MKNYEYKQRIDNVIKFIVIAHGGEINQGDEIMAERQLSEAIGIDRQPLREAMVVLQYNGFIECRWGRKKLALKSIPLEFKG